MSTPIYNYNPPPYRVPVRTRPSGALKVAIVGSRKFFNVKIATRVVARLLERDPNVIIISGGASGADSLAEMLAKRMCTQPPIIIHADWDRYGKSAGFKRNQLLVDASDEIVALWDGASKGTLSTIRLALAAKKPTYVYSTAFKRWLTNAEVQGLAHPDPPAYRRPAR